MDRGADMVKSNCGEHLEGCRAFAEFIDVVVAKHLEHLCRGM